MTDSTKILKIVSKDGKLKQSKEETLKMIDEIANIGFEYISNPYDALNYLKRINFLKKQIIEF
jgi:hypothetical protein